MTKFVLAAILVFALLVGGLLGLLRSRRDSVPPPDVVARVKQRNRELDAQDRSDGKD